MHRRPKADPRTKFEKHDFHTDDLSESDLESIKSVAHHSITMTAEHNPQRAVIDSFMGYLSRNGFKIVKEKK